MSAATLHSHPFLSLKPPTHVHLDLEQLRLALLGHLGLDLPQAGDDSARLVAKEPGDIAQGFSVLLARNGCTNKWDGQHS